MNKRLLGTKYESITAEYLSKNGIRILDKNFRCRFGEIDIIGYDGEYYIFFEVKYRKNNEHGDPTEAVNMRKQRTICRVSDYYRIFKKLPDSANIRYDVISIENDCIKWIKNAYEYLI